MGILGFGKKEEKKSETNTKKVVAVSKSSKVAKKNEVVVSNSNKSSAKETYFSRDLIVRPMITEKAHALNESGNVFVFEITKDTNKVELAKYIKSRYKVEPVKIAIVKIPSKRVISRGKVGFQKGGKKAYVYLNKGDKIEFA